MLIKFISVLHIMFYLVFVYLSLLIIIHFSYFFNKYTFGGNNLKNMNIVLTNILLTQVYVNIVTFYNCRFCIYTELDKTYVLFKFQVVSF